MHLDKKMKLIFQIYYSKIIIRADFNRKKQNNSVSHQCSLIARISEMTSLFVLKKLLSIK